MEKLRTENDNNNIYIQINNAEQNFDIQIFCWF